MGLSLEEALARVPQWAGANDIRTTPLGGGITNRNFRVDAGGESFVLRITGEKTDLLGIDRQNEHAANVAAAALGLAPEVVYFIEPQGYLVTRFVDGRPIPRSEMGGPEMIRRVAAALKQIHAGPGLAQSFSPFRTIEQYTATARQYGVEFPANFGWIMERLGEIERAFAREPFVPCPCHNDLLNENFLAVGAAGAERIYILDWEYAGMGAPAFDLANFAVHHGFDDAQDTVLLQAYYGPLRAPEADKRFARHKLMKIASDGREAMWGVVQTGISKLDVDFRAYAVKHFDRMTQMTGDPRYAQWLSMV